MSFTIGEMESRFADIIRENDGVSSGELVKICEERLNWKKSTTYTMLRRLCSKGICKNENGHVTSLMSRADIVTRITEEMVNEEFGGSLPRFLAAFADRKKLTESEIDEIQNFIDNYRRV